LILVVFIIFVVRVFVFLIFVLIVIFILIFGVVVLFVLLILVVFVFLVLIIVFCVVVGGLFRRGGRRLRGSGIGHRRCGCRRRFHRRGDLQQPGGVCQQPLPPH